MKKLGNIRINSGVTFVITAACYAPGRGPWRAYPMVALIAGQYFNFERISGTVIYGMSNGQRVQLANLCGDPVESIVGVPRTGTKLWAPNTIGGTKLLPATAAMCEWEVSGDERLQLKHILIDHCGTQSWACPLQLYWEDSVAATGGNAPCGASPKEDLVKAIQVDRALLLRKLQDTADDYAAYVAEEETDRLGVWRAMAEEAVRQRQPRAVITEMMTVAVGPIEQIKAYIAVLTMSNAETVEISVTELAELTAIKREQRAYRWTLTGEAV